jgi:hypothetical protein
VQFYLILFKYLHSTSYGTHSAPFLIQGGPIVLPNGIMPPSSQIAPREDGRRPPCSIRIEFKPPDGEALINLFESSRNFAAKTMFEERRNLGPIASKITDINSAAGLLAPAVRHRADAPADRYLPLIEFDNVIKTTFDYFSVEEDCLKPVNPRALFNRHIEIIPTYFCKRAYIGGNGNNSSVQWYLKAATVVACVDRVSNPVRTNKAREAALARGADGVAALEQKLLLLPTATAAGGGAAAGGDGSSGSLGRKRPEIDGGFDGGAADEGDDWNNNGGGSDDLGPAAKKPRLAATGGGDISPTTAANAPDWVRGGGAPVIAVAASIVPPPAASAPAAAALSESPPPAAAAADTSAAAAAAQPLVVRRNLRRLVTTTTTPATTTTSLPDPTS